jgi:Leucine-rich repeat (LRR) protein
LTSLETEESWISHPRQPHPFYLHPQLDYSSQTPLPSSTTMMKISLRHAALALVAAPAFIEAQATDIINERDVLLEFYEATGGEAWNENYGWADSGNVPDICDWHGVICDTAGLEAGGRTRNLQQADATYSDTSSYNVRGLQLDNNFCTGRTPDSLWSLPLLEQVDLSFNPHLDVSFGGIGQHQTRLKSMILEDTATTSITGLAAAADTLEVLQLSKNNLGGAVPADIYSLTHLTSLQLAHCHLQGSLPDDIHRLSMLHEFNLYQNDLVGTLPSGMSRMVHLRHLTLSFNQFHGHLPSFLDDFLLLQEVWAEYNDFTGPVPPLSKQPLIHKVYFNGNSLSGDLPATFLAATLSGPREWDMHVNLEHNELKGTLPASLADLAPIPTTWMLGDNEWTAVPPELCTIPSWNQGGLITYGCAGLLCPPQSYSFKGYWSSEMPCVTCTTNQYWGATTCFDKDDKSVLVELYVALQGEKWDAQENWLQTDDFCQWQGVECWDIGDQKTGRVRKVLLPNNGLLGTIPDTIYSMQHLTYIDFSRNDIVMPFRNIKESPHIYQINIAGTQTTDFDGIQYAASFFHELHADQTPISGTIPKEIFELRTLKVLSLSECDLSGTITEDISGMAQLQELYLSGNNLKGTLPDIWNTLPNLSILALAKNQFTGVLPGSLDFSPSLLALSLQDQTTKGGGLTGALLPFTSTRTLRTLLLGDNQFEGDIPEGFLESVADVDATLPVRVDLENNMLQGKVPGDLDRFQRLQINLQGNFISEIDEQLCLQDMWMGGAVRTYGCSAILCPAGTSGGRRMFIDGGCEECVTTTPTKGAASNFLGQTVCQERQGDLTERDILTLLYDQCGGVGWHTRQYWTSEDDICEWYGIDCDENGSVSSIVLGSNQLVGSFPTEIFTLPELVHLKLYSNTLYFDFEGIGQARKLKTLSLDNTGLESMQGVGNARSLTELNLGGNQLSGAVPEELSRLINLETLTLSRNNLNGYIPYWIQSLVSLTTFDASHNKLEGPVYDFAPLGELIFLDLSHNRLSGSVPTTLFAQAAGNQKVVADFSFNKLSGAVPEELGRLGRLTLQLKGNKITHVDDQLCLITGWNDYDVNNFGCDGILCPAGTFNPSGRQSSADLPCAPCNKAKYMGSTECTSRAAASMATTLGLALMGAVSWFLL